MSMVWVPRVIGRFFCVVSALVVSSAGLAATSGFSVSDNGFSTYTYPIAVPPGIRGLVPELSIAYAGSPTPGGALGTGWALKGVSTIGRCAAVRATDGRRSEFHFEVTDKLCLDGQRLIQTNADGQLTSTVNAQTNDSLGLSGSDYREYRTEIDSFSRIRAYGSANGNAVDGPAYFKVWTKDGRVLEYGSNPNGNANAAIGAQGRTTINTWALSRINDLHGNYIDFKYEVRDTAWGTGPSSGPLPGREWNLLEVQYTGNAEQVPSKKLIFQYTDRADYDVSTGLMQDRSEAYHDGSKSVSIRLLQAVRTYINSANPAALGAAQNAIEVSVIKLGYDNGPTTNRSRLTSLTRCVGASESKCVTPVRFSYTAGGNERYVQAPGYNWGGEILKNVGATVAKVQPADLYGEGRQGVLKNVSGVVAYYRADASGNFVQEGRFVNPVATNFLPTEKQLIDFDGDGLPDVVIPNVSLSSLTLYRNNGNGTFTQVPTPANVPIPYNYLASADSFRPKSCSGAAGSDDNVCLYWSSGAAVYVFDVDGDGIADIVTTTVPANTPMPEVYTGWDTTDGMSVLQPYCLQPAWGGCHTHVYHGNGDGTFTEIPTNMANWSMFTNTYNLRSMTDDGLLSIVGKNYDYPMYTMGGSYNIRTSSTIRVLWLSKGDGNFVPSWNSTMPDSGPTNGCDAISGGVFCFDYNGSGLQSGGGVNANVDSYYGSWRAGDWGTVSGNWGFRLNTGASYLAYKNGSSQSIVIQNTNIPNSVFVKWPRRSIYASLPKNANPVLNVYDVTVLDANGDGRDDLLRWSDDPTENALFLSRGDGTFLRSTNFGVNGPDDQLSRSDGTASMIVGNFTGNGSTEILASNSLAFDPDTAIDKEIAEPYTPIKGSTVVGSRLYVRADASPADLLQTVTSESGLVTQISYTNLGNANGRYKAEAGSYPKASMVPNWHVVTTVTQDSGVGTGTITTDYSYKGLKGNLQGRGMLGFSEVRKQSQGADGTLLSSATRYVQDYPYIGRVASTATWAGTMDQSSPTLLSYSAQAYCDQSLSTQSSLSVPGATTGAGLPALPGLCTSTQALAKPYIQSQLQQQTDLNGTVMPSTTTSYTQTACGDPSTVAQTRSGTIAGGQTQTLTSTTSNSYFADNTAGDNWLRCKVSQSTVQNSTTNPLPNLGTGAGSALYASATQGQPNTIQLSASPASIIMNLQDPGAFSQSVTLSPSGTYTAPLTYTATKQSGATSLVNVSAGATTTFSANLSNYGQSISETYRIKALDYRQHWGYIDIPVQFSVSKKTSSVSVSAPSTTAYAQAASITATVNGASPTGTVTFTDSMIGQIGVVSLSSGTATVTPSYTSPGTHTVTISYSGDGANTASSSSTVITVNKQVPSLSLSASQSVTASGQNFTLASTLSNAVSPSGTVTFYDSGNAIASAGISGTQAVATVSLNGVGSHTLTASYSGDANNTAASSGGLAENVVSPISVSMSPGTSSTVYKVTASRNTTTCGGTVRFTTNTSGGTGQYAYSAVLVSQTRPFSLGSNGNVVSVTSNGVPSGTTATAVIQLTVTDTGVSNGLPVVITLNAGVECERSGE